MTPNGCLSFKKRRYSEMIGAVIAKKKAGGSFDAFNRRDITGATTGWVEDATWTFPGNISISGETKGKKAIEACFAKMMEHYPQIEFTVKEVFVSNIFAMGGTNNIAVEWDVAQTNREGKEFHNSGVSVVRVKGGKVVAVREYVFNTDTVKAAWGKPF
jgi:ketosteroid isomerase-like protein